MSPSLDGRPNIVVVVADTLRTAFLGCYGNEWVRTPNIDRFAAQGVRFTRAHPESLPTIPVRRALHSGRRAYPFPDYTPVPWDNVYLPGWQPMSPEEPTVAETLAQAGYHTGFVGDVPHYFVPGMNFTRGFRQWQFIRGQSEDRYRATSRIDADQLSLYLAPEERIRAHLANVRPDQPEETWPTARTFQAAIDFVEDNAGTAPFYLYVDSFTPHETWEAPLAYYDLYGRRDEREPVPLVVPYAPLADNPHMEDRLPSLRANYAGLVTMVDTWFGRLLDRIDCLGVGSQTLMVLLSDHGTNFADNPEGVLGKPAEYLYPGTMDIPLIVRYPGVADAGGECDEMVYCVDAPATILAAAGARMAGPLDGHSLLPLVGGGEGFPSRQHLTCRYGNSVWFRDGDTWLFGRLATAPAGGDVELADPRVFDLESDPACQSDIAGHSPERIAKAWDAIRADAGQRLRPYVRRSTTDALGRPEFDG